MANSTITCVYTIPIAGALTTAVMARKVRTVPVDENLLYKLGLRLDTDVTAAVGNNVVRTIVVKMLPLGNASASVSRDMSVGPTGKLVNLVLTNPGNGYMAPPILSFADATGSGGQAVAKDLNVQGLIVDNGGSGYTVPVLTFSNYQTLNGTPAQASVLVVGSSIQPGGWSILVAGNGYSAPPEVTITDPNPLAGGAVIRATMGVNSLALINPGTNYTAPSVVITDTFKNDYPDEAAFPLYQGNLLANFMTYAIQFAAETPVIASVPVVS